MNMENYLTLLENPTYFTVSVILLAIVLMSMAFFCGAIFTRLKLRESIKKLQEESVKRSKAVTVGLMGEQISPFLPNFPCNPADVRFVGKPIDFIGFPGAAAGEEIKEILLIEVKTGNSTLSEREKQIKEAVENGRIRYIIYHALDS